MKYRLATEDTEKSYFIFNSVFSVTSVAKK